MTDRRAVIWKPTENSALAVYTYQRGDIKGDLLHRVQYPDGSGDVLLCGHQMMDHSGFRGIADVRRVEEMVRRFLVVPSRKADPLAEELSD